MATILITPIKIDASSVMQFECSPDDAGYLTGTATPEKCPECGPHGNKGRVLLLESWVDCLTCKVAT